MQVVLSESKINSLIRESVLLNVREIEFQQVLKEVYPYFRHVIEEENAKLRKYMLAEGYISHYEYMLEEQRVMNESWLDIMADVGITAGQMIGGPVGQAAGFAGTLKYTKDFIGVVDKSFLEMVGPLLGLFFSMQALLFPMPAVGTIKGILLGFFKGVGNVISGAGGLLARGVTALLSRGHGFIGKAIEILGKALNGVLAAIRGGGTTVAKIKGKIGGSMLSKAMKGMGAAMENFMKRLGILKEGLKNLGKKDVKEVPGMVKDILTKAFQTGKDKLDDALKAIKNTKLGQSVAAAKTKAGLALSKSWKGLTLNATDDVAQVSLKGFVSAGKDYTGYTIKGIQNGMMYLEKGGKMVGVGSDAAARIMAKSPVVKKWVASNLDDAAAATFKQAFGTATSTTKAILKTGTEAISSAISKKMGVFYEKFVKGVSSFPRLFKGVVGESFELTAKQAANLGVKGAKNMRIDKIDDLGTVTYSFLDKSGKVMKKSADKPAALNVFLGDFPRIASSMGQIVKGEFGRSAAKQFVRALPAFGEDAVINKDGSISMKRK